MRLPCRNRLRFDVPGRAGLLCPSFRGRHAATRSWTRNFGCKTTVEIMEFHANYVSTGGSETR